MNYQLVKSRTEALLQQRNSAWVFCIALLCICALQGIGLIYVGVLAHRGRVIERPVGLNAPFWVSSHGVSTSYLAGMSRYLMQLYLDMTPATVDDQQAAFLRHVAPEGFDSVKRALLKAGGQIKSGDLTSVFFMNEPKVDTAALEAKVSGTLVLNAGDTNTVKTNKTFILTFKNLHGQLALTGLTEENS